MPDTPQLYDENEEKWTEKLHVGCGSVYLNGYTNIDVQGVLSSEVDPAEFGAFATDIGDYYNLPGTYDNLPKRGQIIVDKRMDIRSLPYEYAPKTVDKVVAIQSLEHLYPLDMIVALEDIYTMLRSPGVFILSVPDILGTLEWIRDPDKLDFSIRHLRGSLRDDWSKHRSWWTADTLKNTLEGMGFQLVQQLDNFHCYPAVVMKGQKIHG